MVSRALQAAPQTRRADMNRHRIEDGWMRCKELWCSWVGRLSGNEFEVLMVGCDRLAGVLR